MPKGTIHFHWQFVEKLVKHESGGLSLTIVIGWSCLKAAMIFSVLCLFLGFVHDAPAVYTLSDINFQFMKAVAQGLNCV